VEIGPTIEQFKEPGKEQLIIQWIIAPLARREVWTLAHELQEQRDYELTADGLPQIQLSEPWKHHERQ
jgi:hypothetical protein